MKRREFRNYQPMNLQFFADEATGTEDTPTPDNASDTSAGTGDEESTDSSAKAEIDYQAKYVEAEARNKKTKADLDNALKRLGDLNKQLRAKMTEAELEAEKKAQEDEAKQARLKELEEYKAQNEALKRYRLQGMNEELAAKAAKAEIDGDMDALADIQAQHTKALIKEKEAEWKASRPRVNMGDGEENSMTKEEILAIKDTMERQKMIAAHLDLFQ